RACVDCQFPPYFLSIPQINAHLVDWADFVLLMDASDESLEVVFNALDSENKGYITVDQFLSVFNEYFQETNTNGRRVSTIRSDMKKVLEALDPTNDGIIHFEDFKKAFQNEMQKVDESTNLQSTNFSPSTNPSKSGCFSDGLENKTDDSGIHTHETSIFDCDNDSSLSADGLTRCVDHFIYAEVCIHFVRSRLHRDEIRRSWPKQRGAPFLNANNPDSPVSASRSDILIDDMETNFEAIRVRSVSTCSLFVLLLCQRLHTLVLYERFYLNRFL
ncbi:uncharacterized protein DEA37_0012151, partial [Paragonimus westermani]